MAVSCVIGRFYVSNSARGGRWNYNSLICNCCARFKQTIAQSTLHNIESLLSFKVFACAPTLGKGLVSSFNIVIIATRRPRCIQTVPHSYIFEWDDFDRRYGFLTPVTEYVCLINHIYNISLSKIRGLCTCWRASIGGLDR